MAKQKIIILGGGMVGSAIAADLSKEFDITVADINQEVINQLKTNLKIDAIQTDLNSDHSLSNLVSGFDLVICAVPGYMGFNTLKSVIEAGKNVVDISFFSEDPFELDKLAKQNNVVALVDCGIAPGFSNIILGYYSTQINIDRFICYVGGLPFKRTLPFQYKAPFSPSDVIEEYVRPSRIIENGKVIVKPALSEPELIESEYVGTLEAFYTDGLRTLIQTMNIPEMKEKTLRYPGHIDLMRTLRDTGFFNKEKININDQLVSPLDITSQLLFPLWKLDRNEHEFTVLKLIIEGEQKKITFNLFDKYDEKSQTTSMARTTGYTCCAVSRLVLNGNYNAPGISPPEFVGKNKNCFDYVTTYLKERNINFSFKEIAAAEQ